MANIDIDPFGEHESRTEEPTDENILLDLVTLAGGGWALRAQGHTATPSTWEPTREQVEQETSFRGKSLETLKYETLESFVKSLFKRLSGSDDEPPGTINFHNFDLRNGQLYYKGNVNPLTTKKWELRRVGVLANRLGKEGLRDLGFHVPVGKITARQFMASYRAGSQLPSASDIAKADDIELQEIAEKASKSTEDLIFQIKDVQTDTDYLFEHPLQELLGLDKQLRSIRGSLKVEVAKKVQLEERIKKEHCKLEEFRDYPGVYDDAMREDITKQIDALNADLKVRHESIDLLKGRLKNQITSFKETIVKVLDKDTSLGEKIRTLFGEQGITIASILTAIGMAIGVLVEALLPGGGGTAALGGAPKDEKGLKEWIGSKLKGLASLLGQLGVKAAEALPGIIGGIISWILNRTKEVVGWVSQNLWALVVGIGGLICTYMLTIR